MDWKSNPMEKMIRRLSEYNELITQLAALTGNGYTYLRVKIAEYASRLPITQDEAAKECVERASRAQPMPWED